MVENIGHRFRSLTVMILCGRSGFGWRDVGSGVNFRIPAIRAVGQQLRAQAALFGLSATSTTNEDQDRTG